MNDSVDLIQRWLASYQQGDHAAMTHCYHEQATFQDIAFRLSNKHEIGNMWQMICENGIEVVIDEPPKLVGDEVVTRITDTYVLSTTKRDVVNPLTCRFRVREGLIMEHRDECDPIEWANQAFEGIEGWLAGRVGFLRRRAARKKLQEFTAKRDSGQEASHA